jgi:hypothetical protein
VVARLTCIAAFLAARGEGDNRLGCYTLNSVKWYKKWEEDGRGEMCFCMLR